MRSILVSPARIISIVSYLNSKAYYWSATNMSGVTVYGSQAGGDYISANGMTQDVDLIGYGSGNSLFGGAGADTLECRTAAPGGQLISTPETTATYSTSAATTVTTMAPVVTRWSTVQIPATKSLFTSTD